jgi:hypothetical protein
MQSLLNTVQQILNLVIPVIVALGVVYFVWGVVQYFIADAEEAKKTGKDRIIYGIIGLAIITSLWGIVNLLVNTFGLGGASAPVVASAGSCNIGNNFKELAGYVTCVINNSVIPFIFALALVVFVWGVIKFFIINGEEEAKRTEGKQFMIWGLIALTVMLSIWGLIRILGSTVGIKVIKIPQVQE